MPEIESDLRELFAQIGVPGADGDITNAPRAAVPPPLGLAESARTVDGATPSAEGATGRSRDSQATHERSPAVLPLAKRASQSEDPVSLSALFERLRNARAQRPVSPE